MKYGVVIHSRLRADWIASTKNSEHVLRIGRAAGDHLADHVLARPLPRHDQLRHFVRGPVPVFGEGQLQVHHRRADDFDVGVAPRRQRRMLAQVFGADVVAAHVGALAVHHHQLAVVAEVELEAVDDAGMGGERPHHHAAGFELPHVVAG